MKILTIIPARSGSKGIPHKNKYNLFGKPLFVHSIDHARGSIYAKHMKIFVSTDSEQYADIARENGIDVPFLRPQNISGDYATDIEFIVHTLDEYKKVGYVPDYVLHLRPTQPMRTSKMIDDAIKTFIVNNEYTSLRSVIPFNKTPFKMYTIDGEDLKPLYPNLCEMPRQKLEQCYIHNGYIDIYKPNVVYTGSLLGNKPYPYVMEEKHNVDIDSYEDIKTIT